MWVFCLSETKWATINTPFNTNEWMQQTLPERNTEIGLREWEGWSTGNIQSNVIFKSQNHNHKVIRDIDSQTDYPIQKRSNYQEQGENNESGFLPSSRQQSQIIRTKVRRPRSRGLKMIKYEGGRCIHRCRRAANDLEATAELRPKLEHWWNL